MEKIRSIYREETVIRGPDKGLVRRYEAYKTDGGGYLLYRARAGSPKPGDRITPDPATLEEAWNLIEKGNRMRVRDTKSGKNAVFSKRTGLLAEMA